jgi:hypothetical protein
VVNFNLEIVQKNNQHIKYLDLNLSYYNIFLKRIQVNQFLRKFKINFIMEFDIINIINFNFIINFRLVTIICNISDYLFIFNTNLIYNLNFYFKAMNNYDKENFIRSLFIVSFFKDY